MTRLEEYRAFLAAKAQNADCTGFPLRWRPDFLFDFQSALLEFGAARGRAGIFADCGMGKTPIELVWADNVVRETNKPVLLATALAVSPQIVAEAEKFGIEAHRSSDGKPRPNITVTNYERLHLFDPRDYGGFVGDESSAIKHFEGKRRATVTEFARTIPFRLLATATAAPNDYVELGTSSEALGYLGHTDMLSRFFRPTQDGVKFARSAPGEKFRFKGHAQEPFWRWVASWARAARRPSDLGFDDARFALPALIENEVLIESRTLAPGQLFPMAAVGLQEQREERRRTLRERCEAVAERLAGHDSSVIWCHLNAEADLLEKLIPGAKQVSGTDSDEEKEEAFSAFARGQIDRLITKPPIGCFGLNWQHCAHLTYFPDHSYERYYQAVRRCWRFGQTRPVTVDLIGTEGDRNVMANLRRKAAAADEMFAALVRHMRGAAAIDHRRSFPEVEQVPAWA